MKAFASLAARTHLAISALLVVVIYILFLPIPNNVEVAETLSPFVLLLALLLLLLARPRARKARLRYLVWLAFVCLAFFEEIAWGIEWFDLEPLYIESQHVYVQDLHQLFGLVYDLLVIEFGGPRHDFSLLRASLGKLARSGLLWVPLAAIARSKNADSVKQDLLRWFLVALGLLCLFAVIDFLYLPVDPRNVFALGFSLNRLALMAAILLVGSAALRLALLTSSDGPARARWIHLIDWIIKKPRIDLLVKTALTLALLAGLIPLLRASSASAFMPGTWLDRGRPLWQLVVAATLLSLVLLRLWKSASQREDKPRAKPSSLFADPENVYGLAAIGLIVVAQLVDLTWIRFDPIPTGTNKPLGDWALWLEDGFEFSAAILLVLAGIAVLAARQGMPTWPLKQD